MTLKKFETIVTTALNGKFDDASELTFVLMRIGGELDDLRNRLADNALVMAQRFTRYAEETADENRGHVTEPPTGWSNLRDMERDSAKFSGLHEVFKSMFTPVTGKKLSAVIDQIAAAKNA